jgi:RsiW-degrading membrane proteinase PrsW (M82 family)
MVSVLQLVLIIVVAFVPAVLYLLWIRAAEIHEREPFLALEGTFVYGLIIALGLAFILEVIAVEVIDSITGGSLDPVVQSIILAVVLAPFIEEFTKLTGVFAARRRLTEIENGLVYGAAVGLGFAAGENVLYYSNAFISGVEIFVITVIARTLTSTLLHTSASAIAGFGVSRSTCLRAWYGTPSSWVPYYLAAVALHAAFNFLAVLGTDILPDEGGEIALGGLFLSVILVWTTVRYIRRKIIELDRTHVENPPCV